MVQTPPDPAVVVRRWLEQAADDSESRSLGAAFALAFRAVWSRAHRTLGDATLTAIAGRVLCLTAERFPALSGLSVDATGLVAEGLDERIAALPPDERVDALQFALMEFLTLLGRLTAEILTPALHAELAKLSMAPRIDDAGARTGSTRSTQDEESKS